jgi:hypothetical protein
MLGQASGRAGTILVMPTDLKSALAKQRKLQFVAVPPGTIALDMSELGEEALAWAEEQGGRIVNWSIKSGALRGRMRPSPPRQG